MKDQQRNSRNISSNKITTNRQENMAKPQAVNRSVPSSIRVLENHVVIDGLEIIDEKLAKHLAEAVNRDEAFRELIRLALQVLGLSNSTMEVENIKQSAQSVIEQMKSAVDVFGKEMKRGTEELVNPETGAVIRSIDALTDGKLRDLLSPEKEGTPIHILKRELVTTLNTHLRNVNDSITSVSERVTELVTKANTRKEIESNTPKKGLEFEEELDGWIQPFAEIYSDDAQFTGDTPAESGDSAGDEVVTINPAETNGANLRIVWEAKTAKTFRDARGLLKRDKVKVELENAMKNRSASVGIFVSDDRGVSENQPVWKEFEGNKLMIVLDHESPDLRLVRLAYIWARMVALKSISENKEEIDIQAISNIVDNLRIKLAKLKTLKGHHTKAREGVEAAIDFVDKFQKSIDEEIDAMIEELKK